MKGKFEFFNQLPTALQQYTSTFLPNQEAAVFVSASRTSNDVLNHYPAFPMNLRQLVQLVVHGEYDKVKMMLQDTPHLPLFCQRTTVTDYSGREFAPISGFEYALWALDKHMWNDILSYLPRDKAGHLTEEGRVIVAQLQHQYYRVKTEGVTYKLNGVVKTESHYDFALINELQKQVAALNADEDQDRDALYTECRGSVGRAQCLLPVHVVNEYCSKTPFHPVPRFDFRASPTPTCTAREFYNWLFYNNMFSWRRDSKVDFNSPIYKGAQPFPNQRSGLEDRSIVGNDLLAITALYDTRKSEFIELESQLETLQIPVEQPRPAF